MRIQALGFMRRRVKLRGLNNYLYFFFGGGFIIIIIIIIIIRIIVSLVSRSPNPYSSY